MSKRTLLAVLAVLLVVVPFAGAAPLTTLDIVVKVPEYSRQPTLTLEGTTKANIDVHMFVNTVRMRVVKSSSQGVFRLVNVPLTAATNAVRLEAHEGGNIVGKDFTVVYDGTPPVVVLDKEIPAATTANSLTVSGDVNEKVTINYRVTHKADLVAPDIVTGLRASKVEKNAVELAWDPMNISDFREFLVSRDGRPIATVTLPGFRDEGLPTGRQFAYSVAAVDASCNAGNTAELSATTLTGGQNRTVPNATAQLSCMVPFQNASAGSPFSLTLPLSSGANIIEIIFRDAAGNEEVIQQTVLMDNAGPKFLDTNLEEISPSYIPDITIKGKLDERATVFVYVNDEKTPEAYVLAESDGSFSAKVKLRASVRIKAGTKRAGIEVGEGWVNKIRLEAVDIAGNKAALGPVDVDFLLCGSGTWWRANIGEILPSMLLPRLMIQGVQQIGIPFNISYVGSNTAKLGKVDVRPIALAAGAQKDFDHDWVRASAFTRAKGPKDLVGYVQVEFLNVDPLPDKPAAGPNEKEVALSEHRKGECLVPGVGCVKLFLQMDISFQEIIQFKPTDPKLPIASPQIEKRTQKVCMPIEVGIDRTIPSDVIPKGLLRTAVKVVEKAITFIDKVLKPLTTVGEYVLYGCLASNVWLYYNFFTEKMACEGSSILSVFSGGSAWNKDVAEAGLCDEAYGSKQGGSSGDVQKQQKCKSCEQKIESRKKFEENIMRGLCDRIGCPSAPTFSTYIKSKIDDARNLGDVSALVQKNDAVFFKKWALGGDAAGAGGKLFAGNDCAFTFSSKAGTGAGDYITPTYAGGKGVFTTPAPSGTGQIITSLSQTPVVPAQPTSTAYNKLGIRELYDIAKGKTPSTLKSGPTAQDCKQLMRPAHPNCCGVQYQRDWSSACGLGTAVGASLDTFDELKQSTCLSAQQANADAKDLGCNSLWNSVAGFCEKNTGQPSAQVVNPGLRWTTPKLDADGNQVYIFIIPANFDAGRLSGFNPSVAPLGGGGTATQYRIYRGYAVKTPKFDSLPAAEQNTRAAAGKFRLSDSMTAALEKDLTPHFGQVPTTTAQQRAPPKTADQRRIAFGQAMCDPQTYGENGRCDETKMRTQVYDEVDAIVGVPEQQYIVRPYSGLLRSVECACLPAVTSYLQMWRSVLGAFHGCFSKILLTGEGSEGFCAAKLSGTICDLFFEAISCFTQKFNAPGVGARAGTGGFSDVLSALTGAGTDVSRSVGQRYGDTPLYKSLFSDRKLVHAICTWAFTGTWDLNVQGLFQQQVEEIPVDTSGALTTCQRTFISYDPTTTPAGMTTWAYRVAGGLIAGADVRYRLKLKCSSGFSCDPTDYADGKCDCSSKEEVLSVSDPALGNGLAKKFDLVNFDAPFVVSPQTAHDSAGYRYDTAILEWDWTDPQTKSVRTDKAECRIRETEGGRAPAFCTLDAFSGKFRCMFGEQEAGIRITGTTAMYPEKQQVFALGQPLSFGVDLRQKFPEERRLQQQSKKFLTYDIRDGTGATVRGANGVALKVDIADILKDTYALETNGAYRKLVPEGKDGTPLGNFVLDDATIRAHSKSGPAATTIIQDIWGASVTQKFVKNIRVENSLGVPSNNIAWFSIYFPTYGTDPQGEESFTVHRITSPDPTKMPAKGAQGWMRSAALPANLDKQSVQRPQNNVRVTLPPPSATAPGEIVSIDFDHVPRLGNVQMMEILVKYQPQQAPTDSKETCNPSAPVTWKAVFTIYDSDKHGNPTEQVSVDPESGEQQIKDVAFQVQCAQPDIVKGAGPSAQLENILPLIRDLLNKLQYELSDARIGFEVDVQEQPSVLMDKRSAIADGIQRNAQLVRDSGAALDLHFNRVQEPAFKDTLKKLPLLASLTAAATVFDAASTTVRGALPGEVQKVKDTLTATIAKLNELESQAGAALSLFQAPPYNPKFKAGDILQFSDLTLRVTGMTTREGKPYYMFEILDTATNTYKPYANYHAEQFDGFSGATKIGP